MNKYKKKYNSNLLVDPSNRWLPPRALISHILFLQWMTPSRDIPSKDQKSRANPCATPCQISDRKPSQISNRGSLYERECDTATSHGMPTQE